MRFVNVALFFVVPVVIAGNLLFLDGYNLELLLPLGLLFCIATLNLVLLGKGKLIIAAHLLFWSFMAGVWAIMFTDQGSPLIRTNTIVFAFAVSSMLPLLVLKKGWLIPVYFGINSLIFIGFVLLEAHRGSIPTLDLHDYILDTLIAYVFVGIASYGIYTVSQKALERTQREILALEKIRQLLNRIVDAMPSVLFSVDERGHVTSWNDMAARLSGTPSQNAIGNNLFDVFPLLDFRRDQILGVISGAQPLAEKKISLDTDGKATLFDITVYPLVPRQQQGAVIRLDDVSAQVAFEQMMVQSEKMLSVGGLAAGMAHEINNPLGGILQSLQVIRQRLDPTMTKNAKVAEEAGTTITGILTYLEKREILSVLANMDNSGRAAARVVANMVSFSSKRGDGKTPCDLGKLMDEVVEIAGSDFDLARQYDFRRIKIQRDYDPHLPWVNCNSGRIQQVLLNIIKNGTQAMAAMHAEDGLSTFHISTFQKDGIAYIRIADNGPGMDKETRRRAFEPFFTTKKVGKGTGLGLSVSYFIVAEDHRGTLTLESKEGEGSTFTVGLPING